MVTTQCVSYPYNYAACGVVIARVVTILSKPMLI